MARAFPVPWQAAHCARQNPQTIVPVDCTEPFGRGKLAPLYIRVRENGGGNSASFPNMLGRTSHGLVWVV
jgi:hypothetical protein